jgi:hypothetical protein
VRSSEAHGTRFRATIPVVVPGAYSADSTPSAGSSVSSTPRMSRQPSSENLLLDDAARARLALDKFGADDGIAPFLPKDAPLSQSFEELKLAGQLPEMFEMVCERAPSVDVLRCDAHSASLSSTSRLTPSRRSCWPTPRRDSSPAMKRSSRSCRPASCACWVMRTRRSC